MEKLKLDLLSGEYNVGFFFGNFRLHPTALTIGGTVSEKVELGSKSHVVLDEGFYAR